MGVAKAAAFDSASVAAAAVAAHLNGYELPPLGMRWARLARPIVAGGNLLPVNARRWVYAAMSGREGQDAPTVAGARWEELSEQLVAHYPRRRFPAAVIGSAPGAAVNLSAALGVPLLPQTQLVPLRRRSSSPDDAVGEMDACLSTGRDLLAGEPDIALHHMIDPNEDRLTLRWFSYFRIKALRLGAAYERFLSETLEPGATLIVLDCRQRWPASTLGDRYFFQFGGVGGASVDEYFRGGPRVQDFLRRHHARRRRWDPPAPDTDTPEAEWGYEAALDEDIARFAAEHGFRVRRLSFAHADGLSPFVADLYRWWFTKLGRPPDALFAQSFVLLAPLLAMRTATVPYWLTFSDQGSIDALVRYLEATEPYDQIALTLMAHGTDSIGLSSRDDWDRVLGHARHGGQLAGVDPERFPADFGVFLRYRDMLRARPRYPLPPPLTMEDFEAFLGTRTDHSSVSSVQVE